MKRWRNVRSNYFTYCKKLRENASTWSSNSKQLQFLRKQLDDHHVDSRDDADAMKEFVDERVDDNTSTTDDASNSSNTIIFEEPRREQQQNGRKRKLMESVQSVEIEQNDDRLLCFFKSIIPSLDTFTGDETESFQMGVLQLIKSIKRQRTNPNVTSHCPCKCSVYPTSVLNSSPSIPVQESNNSPNLS